MTWRIIIWALVFLAVLAPLCVLSTAMGFAHSPANGFVCGLIAGTAAQISWIATGRNP